MLPLLAVVVLGTGGEVDPDFPDFPAAELTLRSCAVRIPSDRRA